MTDRRPKWLRALDVVETTIAQAEQIIRRNQGLLDELKRVEPELLQMTVPTDWEDWHYKTHAGCPHCGGKCDDCAWANYHTEWCSDAIFDGLTYAHTGAIAPLSVEYRAAFERLWVDCLEDCTVQDMRECIRDIRKFLKAHVRWGKDIIRRHKNNSQNSLDTIENP